VPVNFFSGITQLIQFTVTEYFLANEKAVGIKLFQLSSVGSIVIAAPETGHDLL